MTSLIISILGTLIALASFCIVLYNHKKDKPKIEIYYDIMCNSDSSKDWIRVFFINIGRRATCIKSIGYSSRFFAQKLQIYLIPHNKFHGQF